MMRRVHKFLTERGIPLASNQINLSLMFRKSSAATVDVCRELDVPVIAYFPLANGGGRHCHILLPRPPARALH